MPWVCEVVRINILYMFQGTHCTGETGKMAEKNSLSGHLKILPKLRENTENLGCSSCKLKGIGIFAAKIPILILKLDMWQCLLSQFCVEKTGKHREFENAI